LRACPELGCHYPPPDHRWVGPEPLRNLKLAFVDLLRQLDSGDDPARVVKSLEAEHWLHPELDASVVLLYDVIQVWTATDLHRLRASEVEL
jgi:hypothetical protein